MTVAGKPICPFSNAIAPPSSDVYYSGSYWNEYATVIRELNRRVTGEPDLTYRDYFRRIVDGRRFERALFLNCGDGHVERGFYGAGLIAGAVGIDISEDLLDKARRAGRGLPFEYVRLDINEGRLPHDRYDLIVNNAAGHHIANVDRVLRASCRALTPDGYFLNYDYVGPHRNQYSAQMWAACDRVNEYLPAEARQSFVYPNLSTMLALDPSEAVHSELFVDTFERYFTVDRYRPMGGAIAYLLLTFNEGLQELAPARRESIVNEVMLADSAYLHEHPESTLFAFWYGRPKHEMLRDTQQLRRWSDAEDEREERARWLGGRYYPPTFAGTYALGSDGPRPSDDGPTNGAARKPAKKFWNAYFGVQAEIHRHISGTPSRGYRDYFLEHAGTRHFGRALFLTAGDDSEAREMLRAGIIESAVCAVATEDASKRTHDGTRGTRLRFASCDLTQGELPDERFDLIVNVGVANRIAYIDRAFRAACRALTPGGLFVNLDYVGPHRYQYEREHWDALNAVNSERIPEYARQDLRYPNLRTLIHNAPNDAVHAELVLPTFDRYFTRDAFRPVGGTLAYPLLTFNTALESLPEDEAQAIVDAVLREDSRQLDEHPERTLYAFWYGRPKPDALLDADRLRRWDDEENVREERARWSGGHYYPSTGPARDEFRTPAEAPAQPKFWNDYPMVPREIHRRISGDPLVGYRDYFAQLVDRRRFGHALFINCGDGHEERDYLAAGLIESAVGTDDDADALARAREAGRGLPLRYVRCDTTRGELPDERFDLIVSASGASRIAYLDRALRAACRALAADGLFVGYDYVGPHRSQYERGAWAACHAFNDTVLPGYGRQELVYPQLSAILAHTPLLQVHSELLLEIFQRYFTLDGYRPLGGALAYPLLTFNDRLQRLPWDEAQHVVDLVMREDSAYLQGRPESTLFAFWYGRPKHDVLRDAAQLARWEAEEDERETRARHDGGRYYPPSPLQY